MGAWDGKKERITDLSGGDAILEVRIKRGPETGTDALVCLGADEDDGGATGIMADVINPLNKHDFRLVSMESRDERVNHVGFFSIFFRVRTSVLALLKDRMLLTLKHRNTASQAK